MGMPIEGPDGDVVSVTDHRLDTNSVITQEFVGVSKKGGTYLTHSGFITIANTTDNGMLYIENNESVSLHIARLDAGGGQAFELEVIRNPTGGTLITDASAATVDGTNPRTIRPFSGKVYKPTAASKTITGGTLIHPHVIAANQTYSEDFFGVISIAPGGKMAFKIRPKSATSASYHVNVLMYLGI